MRSGLVALLALSACAQDAPITTESGKPDIVMRGVDRSCVRENLLNGMLTGGWDLKASSDVQIIVQRRAPDSFAAFMYSSSYGGLPYQRVTFTLVPIGPDLRVVVDGAVVSNANSPYEKVNPVTATATDQAAFEALGARAEAVCGKK